MSHSAEYVLGHEQREYRRLALQAKILNPITEELLRRAGVTAGMRVLDLGCGIGEVSLIAARLVGPKGCVMGIDADPEVLKIARAKAENEAFENVLFVCGDVNSPSAENPFDAVVGRYILVHVPDPVVLLRKAFASLHSGGAAIFQEPDLSVIPPAYPDFPLRQRLFELTRDFLCRVCNGHVGTQLYHLFNEAGFQTPTCYGICAIDGGADSLFYEWYAETARTLLPRAQALGFLGEGEIQIDSLEEELRREAVLTKSCCPSSYMVCGFARKP